jgi:hypothetical protein
MPHATAQPATSQHAAPPPAVRAIAPSTAPPSDPAPKRRGNPNLALAPRCGARTRAGCPCRAPAIRGKRRCRMHGGRSTGPRTQDGMARLCAARTIHGRYGADERAFNRHHITFLRRGRLRLAAMLAQDRLPPDFAARLWPMPPELRPPPRPTRGITQAEDRAMLQAETEALAPWKLAIALARRARPGAIADRPIATAAVPASAEAHAPARDAGAAAPLRVVASAVASTDAAPPMAEAHAPDAARPAATIRAKAHAPKARRSSANAAPAAVAPSAIPQRMAEPRAPESLSPPAAPTRPPAGSTAPAEAHAPEQRGAADCPAAAAEARATPDAAEPQAPERRPCPPGADPLATAPPRRGLRHRLLSASYLDFTVLRSAIHTRDTAAKLPGWPGRAAGAAGW